MDSKHEESNEKKLSLEVGEHHHDSHRNSSSIAAYFNIICVIAGTGTLALPEAMKNGGWFAVSFFIITGIISIYTGRLLVECLYYKPGSRLEEFPDIGEAAFGKFGRIFTLIFHYSISLSGACIYILLSGLNIYVMINQYHGQEILSKKIWILLSGIVVGIPFCIVKTLKEVTLLGVFGTLATLITVFCVSIQGGIDFSKGNLPQPVHEDFLWKTMPTSLATIAFSYGGNVVYPHVEATMKNPKSWNKVVFYAITTITAMYLLMAVTGYLYYGDKVLPQVLDSVGKGPGSLVGYILITAHVILAAPIYLCSFALEQERKLHIDEEHLGTVKCHLFRVGFRVIVVSILTLIAMYIPYFSKLMALFGAISNTLIVFLVPLICHYKLLGWQNRSMFSHLASLGVIVFGLLGLIFGSYQASYDLINAIKRGDK